MSVEDIFAAMNDRRRQRNIVLQQARDALLAEDDTQFNEVIEAAYKRAEQRWEKLAGQNDDRHQPGDTGEDVQGTSGPERGEESSDA